MVREKKFYKVRKKNREFYFEPEKIYILKESQGKLKLKAGKTCQETDLDNVFV